MDEITLNVTEIVEEVTIIISEVGVQGPAGADGVDGGSTIEIVAAENILAFDPVNSDGTKGNSATVGKRDRLIGFALANINNGFSGDVVPIGEITNPLWTFTTGNVLFLNGNSISATPPVTGFIQKIGTAKSATIIVINIGQTILI